MKKYMNSLIKRKISALALVMAMAVSVLAGCGESKTTSVSTNQSESETATLSETQGASATTVAETTTAYKKTTIDIMMIGDILEHEGVYNSGKMDDGTYNYDHLFAQITSEAQAADISIVNQETILGGVELGLSGYPCFNSAQETGDAEVKAGFNVILHATNHTLDKGLTGVTNTLNYWKESHPEVTYLGINASEEEYNSIYVYEKDGFKVAILNYTYGTNGIPVPDSAPYCVNLLDSEHEEKVVSDIQRAKTMADMVVVCPHWGTEYTYTPTDEQAYWTNIFLTNGVDLVLGTHPHVLEPVETLTDETTGHQMVVYYSLGNFVSNQDFIPRMLGGMAKVTLVKENDKCYIEKYSLVPLVTHKLFGQGLITTYKLSDYTEALASQNRIGIDSNVCFSADAWYSCKCGAYELGLSTHGSVNFSKDYLNQLSAVILGEQYNTETMELTVTLH